MILTFEDAMPIDTSAPVESTEPQQYESDDWNGLSEWRRKIPNEDESDLITVTTALGAIEVDDLVIMQEKCDTVPSSEELPDSYNQIRKLFGACADGFVGKRRVVFPSK